MANTTIKPRQLAGGLDGWIPAEQTWAYASATTITVPSGAASKYQKGDKIKITNNSATKYFYIVSVADTVLTVTGGSDYTVHDSAITNPYFSKIENPQGFPHWFAFSGITFTCATSGTIGFTNSYAAFCIHGQEVTVEQASVYNTASSPVGELLVTRTSLPVTISTVYDTPTKIPIGSFTFIDVGASNDSVGNIRSPESGGNMYMPIGGINNAYLLSNSPGASDNLNMSLHYRMA